MMRCVGDNPEKWMCGAGLALGPEKVREAPNSGFQKPLMEDRQGHLPSLAGGYNLPKSTMTMMVESGHLREHHVQ